MVHDPDLLDRLSAFAPVRLDNSLFRATRQGLKALTASTAGGRWMPRDHTPVLYTSLDRDGAIAEIVFQFSLLDPKPSKPVMLHQIRASARSVMRLLRASLTELGVDPGG